MKGSYGETHIVKGKAPVVLINVRKHKGDKKELADTIKHELMHAKHPKMHEKTVYKRTAKEMKHSTPAQQDKLIAQLRMKKINQKVGAVKRKLKLGRAQTEPGELIKQAKAMSAGKRTAFMGMV